MSICAERVGEAPDNGGAKKVCLNAALVLVALMALYIVRSLGYQPKPFMMIVAIAASTAFATPINTLVTEAGGYRFGDFMKVGLPLQILALGVTLWIVPLVFPF